MKTRKLIRHNKVLLHLLRQKICQCLPFAIGVLTSSYCVLPLSLASEISSDLSESTIVDHWKDVQSYMSKKGVIVQTINTLDTLGITSGGLRQKTAVAGDIDLILTLDGEQFLNWNDATFFFYGLGVYGDNPSKYVGEAQTVSSIAAPNDWRLFEAWYQQNFFQEHFSLLAGLYDVTSEFDVIRSSSELFLNSSFGTGPELASSGRNGPSTFPTTSLAIRGQGIVSDDIALRAVIADGVPGNPSDPGGTNIKLHKSDGVFIATEFSFYDLREKRKRDQRNIFKKRPFRLAFQRVGRAAPVSYQGKYAVGFWGYTTDFNDLSHMNDSGQFVKREGTYGIYGLAEQIIYREHQDREQNLTLFARIGFADPRVNRFSQYYGGGLVYRGLISHRDDDEIGVGIAAALNGSHFKRAQLTTGNSVDDAEIALEMTYAININQEIIIQPNLQYIINPDTDPKIQNAVVIGARLELNLDWFGSQATSVENRK